MKWLTALALLLFALPAQAEGLPITRTEGLKLLWEPLKRAIEEVREQQFLDVPALHPDHALITFAKARGIVQDNTHFAPDDPLHVHDALLWLLHSRNVATWSALRSDTAPAYARKYGLLTILNNTQDRRAVRALLVENPALTVEQFTALITTLDTALAQETHAVSYYGESFAGRRTAFGEVFDPGALTAAHRTLPHNTIVRVSNPANGRSVAVRINDRGPYVHSRDMDLSRAAFEHLAPISRGILHGITFERLGSTAFVAQRQEVHTSWYARHAARRTARRKARN